jgi:effector-binding domain-containing protein/uncharacterized protein YndB with AHSA1/START domain
MLKKILIGLVGLLIILVLVGFLLPGQVEISRSITINAPAEYAFEEVNNLENHPKWSYWNSIYKEMTTTYGDLRKGAGAVSSWTGEESGNGTMTITESVTNSSIKFDINFMDDEDSAKSWYTFEPDGDGTKLTTGFLLDAGMNPITRWMCVIMKPEMNKAFDYNLSKLKEIAEAKPKFTVALSVEETKPVSYIGISSTVSMDNMDAMEKQMSSSYGELMGALAKAKIEMTGAPFCIYNKWDEATKQTEFVCALPVPDGAKVPAKYKLMQTSGGMAVKAINLGSYDNLGNTHGEIEKFISFKNLEIIGAPWEIYVTDPEMEKDTTKWITEVYYPVKKKE